MKPMPAVRFIDINTIDPLPGWQPGSYLLAAIRPTR